MNQKLKMKTEIETTEAAIKLLNDLLESAVENQEEIDAVNKTISLLIENKAAIDGQIKQLIKRGF